MMLDLAAIDTYYGETQALFGVSLDVAAGEVVALLGANGAGKTTTLRSILGLTRARRGSVGFDGRDVTRVPTHEIARAGVGWVPDDRRIFPTLTVERNLAIAGKKTRFRAWTLKECFEVFSALEYLMHRECENLSGGEMQMVAIARVLLGAPGLVLLDEPSQGLAPKVVQDVMRVVRTLRAEGVGVLLVEQNVATALEVADRAYVLDRGTVVFSGPAAQLRDDRAPRQAPGNMSMLRVEALTKVYTRGRFSRAADVHARGRFRGRRARHRRRDGPERLGQDHALRADHRQQSADVGPRAGAGQDIHRVRYAQRSRMAMHYHQSYQVRSFRRTKPSFLLERARSDRR